MCYHLFFHIYIYILYIYIYIHIYVYNTQRKRNEKEREKKTRIYYDIIIYCGSGCMSHNIFEDVSSNILQNGC